MEDASGSTANPLEPPPAEDVLSSEEILSALDSLCADDKNRLALIEARHLTDTDFAKGDLLHEATGAALLQIRKCPRGESFVAFLAESMRSIASHRRERLAKQVEIETDGQSGPAKGTRTAKLISPDPSPEAVVLEMEEHGQTAAVLQDLMAEFKDDEEAQLVLIGWGEDLRGRALREAVGVDQSQIDYIIKTHPPLGEKAIPKWMVAMSKKVPPKEELSRIDKAIDESILHASMTDLREELADLGEADKVAAEIDAVITRAKETAAKVRFAQAKEELSSFKKRQLSPTDDAAARSRLHAMRSNNSNNASGMMLAARKGKGQSESDEEGIIDDLAQLAALEADDADLDKE